MTLATSADIAKIVAQLRQQFPDLGLTLDRERLFKVIGREFSKPYLNDMEKAGKFPRRLSLFDREVVWQTQEILEWVARKMIERDAAADVRRHLARPAFSTRMTA